MDPGGSTSTKPRQAILTSNEAVSPVHGSRDGATTVAACSKADKPPGAQSLARSTTSALVVSGGESSKGTKETGVIMGQQEGQTAG
jgi:hypothetical protein